jgi:hypothetical protein
MWATSSSKKANEVHERLLDPVGNPNDIEHPRAKSNDGNIEPLENWSVYSDKEIEKISHSSMSRLLNLGKRVFM